MLTLGQDVVDTFISMLTERMPEEQDIKAYVNSEQSLQAVSQFPIVFVLCPEYMITKWYDDGYIDVDYTLLMGVIVLEQNPEALRNKLYSLISDIIVNTMQSESDARVPYTFNDVNPFRASFGPVFTNGAESFMGDAQVSAIVRRKRVG